MTNHCAPQELPQALPRVVRVIYGVTGLVVLVEHIRMLEDFLNALAILVYEASRHLIVVHQIQGARCCQEEAWIKVFYSCNEQVKCRHVLSRESIPAIPPSCSYTIMYPKSSLAHF